MAALQNLGRDQKVRFLASEILCKGVPQTFEDVCTDCQLFSVTPAELLEFTVLPVKFGNCLATALYVPSPGFMYVTPAFCQEIGRKSVVTPFSLSQNQGGNWPRNIASVTPPLPDFRKSKIPSRPVIDESTCCQVPSVDGSTPLLSNPSVDGSHFSECPSGIKLALTHAGITEMEGCVQSNASYLSGSTLSQTPKVGKTTAFLSSPQRISTELARCPSNCQSVPSQGLTKDGVVRQGGELGYHELLQLRVNAMPSACGVYNADEVYLALGPNAAGKGSAARRGRRPKAAQKLELRGVSPEVEEYAAAQNWPRNIASATLPFPDAGKPGTPSKPVIGESTSSLVGDSHVSECPSGIEPALTHAGIIARKGCVQSNGSYLPMSGSTVFPTPKVDKATAFLSYPHRISTEYARCPSNCQFVPSQGPTKDGVVHQGGELGYHELLQRQVNAMPSTCGVHKANEVSPALGPIAAAKRSTLRRSPRLKAAQKMKLRGESLGEECGAAQNSELSSRVIQSATGNPPEREIGTPQKKRGRDVHDRVRDEGTPVKRKRLMKRLMAPDSMKEDIMEGKFHSAIHPCIDSVRCPALGRLEHAEVLCEKKISLSCTHKSGVAELENPVQVSILITEEAGSTRKKSGLKTRSCTPKLKRTASTKHGGAKVVTSNPSLAESSTPGLTCSQLVYGSGPVVGGAVDLEITVERRISSSCAEKPAGKELEYRENCSKPDQEFAGKFAQPPTRPKFCDGRTTATSFRYENSPTPEKSAGSERAHLLYVSDSGENSSTAELPQAGVKDTTSPMGGVASPSGAHDELPKLRAKLPGAEMMQLQAVHWDAVNSLEVEEAIGPEVASRAGSLEHLTCINNILREMDLLITSSAAEHIEGACSSGLSCFDGKNLKMTVPEVQLSATLPRADFPEDARGDVFAGGYSLTANEKQPAVQVEYCAKSHISMDSEYLHHDGDDCAALARESQVVQMEHYQAIRNSGEVTVMCVEPGVEITERNAHLHTGTSAYDLNIRGATPGAAEERPLFRSTLPKNGYQPLGVSRPDDLEENEVRGEEPCISPSSSLEKRPIVHSDHAVVCGVSGGLATEEAILDSNRILNGPTLVYEAPILEAKRSLGDKYPESSCAMDFVGFSTVSETAVNSIGTHDGAYSSYGKDPCCRKVVTEEDYLKVLSRINPQKIVSAVPQKEAVLSYVFATRDERPGMFASPHKPAVAAKLEHVQGHHKKALKEKVRFVPMERSQVRVEEGTHITQKPGESIVSGHLGGKSENRGGMRLVEDAVNVQLENSGKHFLQEIVKETAIESLGTAKNFPGEKKPLAIINVTINGTRDSTHPGNEAGTYLRRNSGEHISKELIAVQETVVPTSVKVIDTVPQQKNQEFKIVPEFDNYTVIAEEGSGGYGTVYRVMNNATERIYAMKCPLLKTNTSCVQNEISMLKKLGGKECIIKFKKVVPGRLRTVSDSGEKLSECESILLEFMEHDKPEILKKEITIEELRNYSVCLFRALAHMHRLSIMHLDVKPGNFLFARSKKRGYLVDFNLARDEQKQPKRMKKVLSSSLHISSRIDSSRRSSKRPPVQDVVSTPVSYSKRSRLLMGASGTQLSYGTPSPAKTGPVLQDQSNKFMCHGVSADAKVSSSRLPDLAPSRSTTTMGALSSPWRTAESPKPENQHCDPEGARQQCEGSADVHKNQTLGPIPQSGHRALLKYIQTKVYNQQPPVFTQLKSPLPASQRKRVAAVQNKRKAVTAGSVPVTQQTVQPLIARKLKAPGKPKGCNDQVKDGACVGTKGYRAPEVLLRSLKQTTKVDMWSAGVSLLQLVSGRSPFPSTSTEGALKDIAKVRGSDKILALATRHQRQHSISKDLCAMRSSPISLKEWCEKHSKRPDLKGRIPPELFDLLEKCLDVDPASRITAEEALNHQFCSSMMDLKA